MTGIRRVAQAVLGVVLCGAGIGHLVTHREQFRAIVPPWVPVDADAVVVASGIVELGLGAALVLLWRQPLRAWVGALTAVFLVAVLPANVDQFVAGRDAFGLQTDAQRAGRLLVQPLLVAWAVVATDARRTLVGSHPDERV